MNPLNSVKGAIALAFVLAAVISVALTAGVGIPRGAHSALTIWLHVVSGVMWIGLLYYFNVVQTPGLAVAAADKGGPGGAGIAKYIAPRALLWFRWAAVATWATGAVYLLFGDKGNNFVDAFTLGLASNDPYDTVIGVGAWLGTIMLFNVWVFIWPNQKKILGIVPATDEEKAAARKTAGTASRINFVLSVPMLMCMIGAHHWMPF